MFFMKSSRSSVCHPTVVAHRDGYAHTVRTYIINRTEGDPDTKHLDKIRDTNTSRHTHTRATHSDGQREDAHRIVHTQTQRTSHAEY